MINKGQKKVDKGFINMILKDLLQILNEDTNIKRVLAGGALGSLLGYLYHREREKKAQMDMPIELVKCGDDRKCKEAVLRKYSSSAILDTLKGALIFAAIAGSLPSYQEKEYPSKEEDKTTLV